MNILQEVEQMFPECVVTMTPCPRMESLARRVILFTEKGRKYLKDGSTNPEYWWHEWYFDIASDETRINRAFLAEILNELKITVREQIAKYETDKEQNGDGTKGDSPDV